MTEKFKIYIPEETKSRLMNDAELFDFTKNDGSVNLNAFLKELLVNYFDQYREMKKNLLDTILSDLSEYSSITDKDASSIADKIINTYMKTGEYRSERKATITLTVSGRSLDVMRSIENNMLTQVSLSQYLNDLLSSYLSISRSSREMIIFRDTFEDLNKAIKNKRIITFSSTSSQDLVYTIRPYMIAASKEEQCNYLLCTDNRSGQPRTFRISRIRALYVTSDTFNINKDILQELTDVALRNPQSASKNVEAKVVMTDRGIRKFHLVVKNRPDVERREGNTFYFNWPKRQLEDYFSRFGKDAVIVSPQECTESLKIFYGKALDAYKKALKNINA